MVFTNTQTLDGSFFEYESARHDSWTGLATDTAVLMTGEGQLEQFWLALSKGHDDTLLVGYGTTEQTEWKQLPAHPNISGRLLSENDNAEFWKIHQPNLSQDDCNHATLKLLHALHGRRGKTAVQADRITGKSLMVVTNSALDLFQEQLEYDCTATSASPAWAKIDYFLNPSNDLALYGATAIWSSVNRSDLVLVMQHQPGKSPVGTVFSTITGHLKPLQIAQQDGSEDKVSLSLDCTNLNGVECQSFLSKLIQGDESGEQIACHVKHLYEAYQMQAPKVHKDLSAEDVGRGRTVEIVPTKGDGLDVPQTSLMADVEVLRSRV